MRPLRKWLLPALGIIELLLVHLGILDGRAYVVVSGAVEVLFLVFIARHVMRAIRVNRIKQESKQDVWQAVELDIAAWIPRPVARLGVLEVKVWYSLGAWLFRRAPSAKPSFAYHERTVIGLFLLLAVIEIPAELVLAEALIPWSWLRALLLFMSVYAFCWMAGFWASLRVLRHRLETDGLRIYFGALAEGFVPYEDIVRISQEQCRPPRNRDGLQVVEGVGSAYIVAGGRTDLTIQLRSPQRLRGFLRPTAPVTAICLAADEPEEMASALLRRIHGTEGRSRDAGMHRVIKRGTCSGSVKPFSLG